MTEEDQPLPVYNVRCADGTFKPTAAYTAYAAVRICAESLQPPLDEDTYDTIVVEARDGAKPQTVRFKVLGDCVHIIGLVKK